MRYPLLSQPWYVPAAARPRVGLRADPANATGATPIAALLPAAKNESKWDASGRNLVLGNGIQHYEAR